MRFLLLTRSKGHVSVYSEYRFSHLFAFSSLAVWHSAAILIFFMNCNGQIQSLNPCMQFSMKPWSKKLVVLNPYYQNIHLPYLYFYWFIYLIDRCKHLWFLFHKSFKFLSWSYFWSSHYGMKYLFESLLNHIIKKILF